MKSEEFRFNSKLKTQNFKTNPTTCPEPVEGLNTQHPTTCPEHFVKLSINPVEGPITH
jgi:hypothetical protein